jgi:proline racemase
VPAQDVGVRVDTKHLPALRKVATAVLQAAKEQLTIDSPAPWIQYPAVSAVIIRDKSVHLDAHQRNILIGTSSFDRSPCGTGTSAWIAVLHARGKLALDEDFVHESVIGGLFRGVAVEETKVGAFDAVVPEITGSAHITAFHDFVIDPGDPYKYGFRLISA